MWISRRRLAWSMAIFLTTTAVTAAGCVDTEAWKTEPIEERPVSPAAPPVHDAAPRVALETSLGTIVVGLYPGHAPLSVANFLQYVDTNHYDGTVFHRVIWTSQPKMIQGGGFGIDRNQKPTREPVKNEANNGLSNVRGTVALARTAVVDSATTQFFINHEDNTYLDYRGENPRDYGYAVFGVVVEGMDVVDRIARAPIGTETGMFQAAPAEDIVILNARRVTSE